MSERWQNQEEALHFALENPSCMLDMEMGTGKTRVAIDAVFAREDVHRVLVVCPKAVVGVWRTNLMKFHGGENWYCWDKQTGTVTQKTDDLAKWFGMGNHEDSNLFVVINYDSVWRHPIGDYIYTKAGFDMVILDESHRAKAAGSKVSKYLAMVGKRVKYKMCLSGTPMANSPLDVYGQYRFLDPTIFGTNYDRFRQEYAILGGPEHNFVVGYKNQQRLNEKFSQIAYTCKMADIKDKIKLPDALPPIERMVDLPTRDMQTLKTLAREFVAECGSGNVIATNVLVKILRQQQITSGFCQISASPLDPPVEEDLNYAKLEELKDIVTDIATPVVVFCMFKHDLDIISKAVRSMGRQAFELSGRVNELDEWKKSDSGVLAVQVQAGSEGVDMTNANHVIYFSLPHSMALYNQSKARLYRPGQTRPVSFIHILARKTVDEAMYKSLMRKMDIVDAIRKGEFDMGFSH